MNNQIIKRQQQQQQQQIANNDELNVLNEVTQLRSRTAAGQQNGKNSLTTIDGSLQQKQTKQSFEFKTDKPSQKQPVLVKGKIIFSRIGEINTKAERFDSEIYYECSWEDDKLLETVVNSQNLTNLKRNDFQSKLDLMTKNLNKFTYNPNVHWSPKVYIDNAIGEPKGETSYKIEIVKKENLQTNTQNSEFLDYTIRVTEMRSLRGVFYERLELFDFPMDMQELSVTLSSKLDESEVLFEANEADPSSVYTKVFLSQQEWDLFDYVNSKSLLIYDKWRKFNRSAFRVTSFVARKPGYYLNNAYMLMFLITVLGFVAFAIDLTSAFGRAQITGVLILTSVNFRWIITQRLPSVPYLTSLDKYAIGNLFFLVLFLVWHSIIASNMLTYLGDERKYIDQYVLIAFAIIYFVYNLVYAIWFIKMRNEIEKKRKHKIE